MARVASSLSREARLKLLPSACPAELFTCHAYLTRINYTRPIPLSVTQSAFASTSDRPLCFPRACVGLIGPRPSDYPHALSACYYFLPAVFLLALGLWSSLPARQLSLDTSYSFLTFCFFFFFFFFLSTERIDESYIKAPTATSNCRLTTSEDAWAFFGR